MSAQQCNEAPYALLTVIRHAESMANAKRVLQGVTDAPLSPLGHEQLAKLEAAWRTREDGANAYALPAPTLIVTSPIGRARKTAAAIARGCGVRVASDHGATHRSPPLAAGTLSTARHDRVLVDAGLAERNYGTAECSRNKQNVPEFPRPPMGQIGRADSVASFSQRVAVARKKWVGWLCSVGRAAAEVEASTGTGAVKRRSSPPVTQQAAAVGNAPRAHNSDCPHSDPMGRPASPDTDATPDSSDTERECGKRGRPDDAETQAAATSSASGPARPPPARPVPHLVLVTHGQWINACLSRDVPELRSGKDAFYIRSHNTGLFTLELGADGRVMQVLRHNDTSHLGAGPPAKSRRAAQKTTLTDLWRGSQGVEFARDPE
ncbi:hypothetical protein MSPP1_001817 [Malassezia sp. CBS 17886]|nr:hypothetical protein MSPP1_001817 [Malassezia sp. CBS 17886]